MVLSSAGRKFFIPLCADILEVSMKKGLFATILVAALALMPKEVFAVDLTVKIQNTTASPITLSYTNCSGAPCPAFPVTVAAYTTANVPTMSAANGGPMMMIFRYGNGGNIGQFTAWNAQWGGAGGPCAFPFSSTNKSAGNPTVSYYNENSSPAPSCAYSVTFKYGP